MLEGIVNCPTILVLKKVNSEGAISSPVSIYALEIVTPEEVVSFSPE